MKKLLTALLLMFACNLVFADGWHGGEGWRGGWGGGEGWRGEGDGAGWAIGSALVGGVLGGMMAQQAPIYAAPAPMMAPPAYMPAPAPAYVYPQPAYVQPVYPAPYYGRQEWDDD